MKIKRKQTPSIITRTTGDVCSRGERLICISALSFVFSDGSIVFSFSNIPYATICVSSLLQHDVVRKMAQFTSSYFWYTDFSRIQFCADVQLPLSASQWYLTLCKCIWKSFWNGKITIFGFESVALTTAIPNGKHLIYWMSEQHLRRRWRKTAKRKYCQSQWATKTSSQSTTCTSSCRRWITILIININLVDHTICNIVGTIYTIRLTTYTMHSIQRTAYDGITAYCTNSNELSSSSSSFVRLANSMVF